MPSENILSHFWELASVDEKTRLKAASQLLQALNRAQKQQDERGKVKYTYMYLSLTFITLLCMYIALHGNLHIDVGFRRGF